jgi:hypothetical protein
MRFDNFSFGSIQIDGSTYEHDVIIDHGEIRKRKKKPSKKFQEEFGHTPLSAEEKIPWKCRQLVIGTGAYGKTAGDARGKTRGRAPKDKTAGSADHRSN